MNTFHAKNADLVPLIYLFFFLQNIAYFALEWDLILHWWDMQDYMNHTAIKILYRNFGHQNFLKNAKIYLFC